MKTIEEKNNLIAEYMNIEVMTIEELRIVAKENRKNGLIHVPHREIVEDLKYHDSWDWLMPVAQKVISEIRDLNDTSGLYEWEEAWSNMVEGCCMEEYYNFVVEFIEWYNENESMGDTCRNGKPWDKCNCC